MAPRSTVDQPRGFPLPFPCGWNVGWETRGQDSDDGREGTSPSAVPTCNTPFTEYYDSVPRDRTINPLDKIRLLNAPILVCQARLSRVALPDCQAITGQPQILVAHPSKLWYQDSNQAGDQRRHKVAGRRAWVVPWFSSWKPHRRKRDSLMVLMPYSLSV